MKKLAFLLCICFLFTVACGRTMKNSRKSKNTNLPNSTDKLETNINSDTDNSKNENKNEDKNKTKGSGQETVKPTVSINKNIHLNTNIISNLPSSVMWKDAIYKKNQVHYPVVYGLSNTIVQDKLNSAIYALIDTHANKAVNDADGLTVVLNTSYKVEYNKNKLFSIRFYHTDNFGGAHPGSEVESITLDIKTGSKVTLDSLFLPGYNYIITTNNYIKQKIPSLNVELTRNFEGVVDKNAFYLSNSGFVFYFQAYDYTPYAYGPLEFVIPYSKYSSLTRTL